MSHGTSDELADASFSASRGYHASFHAVEVSIVALSQSKAYMSETAHW